MDNSTPNGKGLKLGINGFGRIGKLAVWQNVGRKYFDELIINVGRGIGTSLKDIAHYAETDSTYGLLHGFLYGCKASPVIHDLDEKNGTMTIDGTPVRFLRSNRNPAEIGWRDHDVRMVIDTT